MKIFIINFWIWWYFVFSLDAIRYAIRSWLYYAGYFRLGPMITNLFVPLYQDNSMIGRMISFPIRLVWIIVASFFQILVSVPIVIVLVFVLLLPLLPVFVLINSFFYEN